jgi:hypothetical protein
MMCTGSLFHEEHEQPYDFYRYTQFGFRYSLDSTGFIIDRLEWLEGYFGTVGYQLNTMARYLPRKPRDLGEGLVGEADPGKPFTKPPRAAWDSP